ncbi:MAG TPA: porin family protein [Flavipsychrobacter sp.]|nr:porin family protein [Flavipsychrobacter sp.]
MPGRYLLFLLLFITAGCNTAGAQDNFYIEDPHMTFNGGLILGANFTQVDGDTYSGYHKIGLNTGGIVYIHFNKTFGVSMELLYSQKGSRGADMEQSVYVGTYIGKYFINLNYAEVPLLLHCILKLNGLSRSVDFEAGGSYARLISAKEWAEMDQPVSIDPVRNHFNNVDVDYIFGVGMKLYKHWYADARFQYSLISIRPLDRIPYGFSYGDRGQFNNLVSLRLLYMF